MGNLNDCSIIEVGDVFTRVDKNGTVWKAEVINRTDCFVDVKKYHPYEVRFQVNEWKTEKRIPEPTTERCMLHRVVDIVETGNVKTFGKLTYKETKQVPTNKYYIELKEDYSKSSKYDKTYTLVKVKV